MAVYSGRIVRGSWGCSIIVRRGSPFLPSKKPMGKALRRTVQMDDSAASRIVSRNCQFLGQSKIKCSAQSVNDSPICHCMESLRSEKHFSHSQFHCECPEPSGIWYLVTNP